MKKIHNISASVLFLFLLFPAMYSFAQFSAEQLADKVYHRDVGRDMQLTGTMELINEKGDSRIRQFISMRKDSADERQMLIQFTAPADIEGTGFLSLENLASGKTQQFLYLPALQRTRRIVAGQQGRSFVNSDFTYEDMQRHPVAEWSHQLGDDVELLGQACYTLTSIPKASTDSQYSKIVSRIEKTHYIPLQIQMWDSKGAHVKTLKVLDYKVISGIATETEVVMEDHADHHTTRLRNENIRYNQGLPDYQFTTRALER